MDTLFFNPPPTIRSTYNIKNKSIFYVTRKHIIAIISKKKRQYNGQKEKAQKYTQWSIKHYRTKEWTLRTPLKTRDLL